ncbi:MAG TPA: hypothetical protein EYF97_05870 [Gammaproteobacteria bacterium]|jgi:hypothetical protein|nr:hypothetical protein [Gammaproteobacteria bacterium]HIK72782.1 hypothetical protein [Gammaproteobacteria bacterium]
MDRRKFLKISGLGLGSAAVLGWGINSFNLLGRENYYLQGNFLVINILPTPLYQNSSTQVFSNYSSGI